ncbi:acyl carrier protein [Fuscovulum ytuae]|jgi:acyl carrier protein|uniref:Acyl carrier protein AcpXL n=1 Tax=Fuscovulum ytuae TaxID=3042299 RepID=A0ABY8Q860_9RHOB|nr:phosphopantetheine-binding protein [Fuscovulum sp. YMD61]WGV17063.1 phosphopantetheine-binding protein [Fuscovulum sp. YMD61]
MEVRDRVIAIIAEKAVLAPADVTMQSSLSELGVDSLAMVEAIFAMEEVFDISIPFNANDPNEGRFDISTVGSIVAAVEELLAQKVT